MVTLNQTDSSLLGEVVSWDMGALEVPYAQVLNALASAGLPSDAAVEMRAQTAFTRAVRDLREGRTIDRIQADKGSSIISFQFTRKHLQTAALKIDFDYEAVCQLDTDNGDIDCPESLEIEQHAQTMFKHALEHRNTSDVTRLVQVMFKNHADLYPINPKKGVAYFVPEAHREFSAKVEDFLQLLGGRLWRFPVPKGTPEGDRSVKQAVEDGLQTLAAELAAKVDEWDEHTRNGTFEKAIEQWQQIKHKAEAYSEYLGDRQANLLAVLDEQRRRLSAKVAEVMQAKENATRGDDPGQQTLFSASAEESPPAPELVATGA